MSERPKQEWRIEAGPTGSVSRVYLNGDEVPVRRARLEVGVGAATTLTLELLPQRVTIVVDPELHLIVGSHRFQVIDEGSAPVDPRRAGRITPETYCYCGHQARDHEQLSEGRYGTCLMPRDLMFPRCGICGGFARPYSTDRLHEPGERDDGLFRE